MDKFFSYFIPIAIIVAIGVYLFFVIRQRRFREKCYVYLMERQPDIFVMIPKRDYKQKMLIAEKFVKEDFWDDYLVYTGKYEYVDEVKDAEYEET